MKKQNLVLTIVVLLFLVAFTACAPEGQTDQVYGFWYGIWHGICLPFALIGKIFGMDIGIHALQNSGTWYWVGYLIGFGIITGGSGKAANR